MMLFSCHGRLDLLNTRVDCPLGACFRAQRVVNMPEHYGLWCFTSILFINSVQDTMSGQLLLLLALLI